MKDFVFKFSVYRFAFIVYLVMLFRVSDVYKSYSSQDVLRGASFQINAGEHVGLGASPANKKQ